MCIFHVYLRWTAVMDTFYDTFLRTNFEIYYYSNFLIGSLFFWVVVTLSLGAKDFNELKCPRRNSWTFLLGHTDFCRCEQ